MEEIKVKSVVPIYLVGVTWIVYSAFFPLYRGFDFIVVTILSVLVYLFFSGIIKPKVVMVPKKEEPINTGNETLDEVLTTGNQYTKELQEINRRIYNGKINQEINDIVKITSQMFEVVKKNPNKLRHIRQFMNYYLPTTIKLLNSYDEFARQTAKGENITAAMNKIETMMDTITDAFKKMLDDLFKDKILDTSVDIEIMEKMLNQEEIDNTI